MVARVTLHNMKQDRDEPVRAYGARLKGQASVCKFTQRCTRCDATVDYTEAMLKDVLCRGLEDTEIQMDLLGDRNQDMTLEQIFRFVEAKEAGKRSASRLLLPQATDAVTGSSYKRQKKQPVRDLPPKDRDACTYCGTKGHGRNPPTRVRRTECPAFGAKCNHCGKDHHFERMCRNKNSMKSPRGTEHKDCVRHTMRDHISRHHQGHHTRPPHLQSSYKGMAEETIQTPTIRQAPNEHQRGGLCALQIPPQSTAKAVLC